MSGLNFMGDFPQVALAMVFSIGCALLASFICLRIILRLVTREQYNVTDAPRRVRALVWVDPSAAGAGAADGRGGTATGGPYLLPAAAPRNRFSRIPKSDAVAARRFIELSQRAGGGTAEGRTGTSDHGAA